MLVLRLRYPRLDLSPAKRRAAALVAIALFAPTGVPAQGSPVPPALQATTFDKVFDFDRALGDRSKLKVWLVHGSAGGGRDAAVALQGAFSALAIAAEPVALPAAAARFQSGTVAYLLPGAATTELLEAAASAQVLTISGDAALAVQGKVSVGLALRGDKAEIVVNLDRVAQEGHDFSAQLLKFARVVRGGAGVPGSPGSPGGAAEGPAPVLVSLTKPEYPAVARRLRLEGDVVMRLSVDARGKVTDVELVKGLGRGDVDEAAMAAARTARFKPAIRNGSPVPSRYLLVIPFRL